MGQSFDVLVIGLGAHGSAALYHLSKTGKKVAGIDRFTPPHVHGSSHGGSRIIRQAYHEGSFYVPLVRAAYPLWEALQRESDKTLLIKTGGLLLGTEDSATLKGARTSAQTFGIEYEDLDAAQIRRRFPAFRAADDTIGVSEKEAGILFPETCIQSWLAGAAANNAELHYNERVTAILPRNNEVEVTTDRARYTAGKVIVSAGAWLSTLLPELDLPLTVERQVMCWFDDRGGQTSFLPANMPVYLWEYDPGRLIYGIPQLEDGIKIAFHHAGRQIQPDDLHHDVTEGGISAIREVTEAEISAARDIARRYLTMDPIFRSSSVCMYTNTPDEHFLLDTHPHCNDILIASPCSGHGFKFSSVIGKILSDLATDQPVAFDLTPFAFARFVRKLQ
ncbi:MAG TPA: N-methyl-L-tryptophan oxidase [Puia sp.]|jgi:sarcosine oxidase|nr:N-methyl-L-tryptophan oxidase [Puia sp.]